MSATLILLAKMVRYEKTAETRNAARFVRIDFLLHA